MSVIDLSGITDYPWFWTGSLGTTWQGFTLPPGCGKVTVINEHASQSVYVAGDKAGVPASVETPTDGGVVGTHRGKVVAGATVEFIRRGVNEPLATSALFLAGSGASTSVSLVLEPRP